MKKLVSILLSMAMLISAFSVLGVAAYGADSTDTGAALDELPEGTLPPEDDGDDLTGDDSDKEHLPEDDEQYFDAVSLSFVPSDDEDYSTYPYSNGSWEWLLDDETGTYGYVFDYWYLDDIFIEGNQLVFTNEAGETEVYTCDSDYDYVNEDGEVLEDTPETEIVCGENGEAIIVVSFGELSCEYFCTMLESEVEKVEYIDEGPVHFRAYIDGWYNRLSYGENKGDITFWYSPFIEDYFGFVVTYKDGTKRTAEVDEYGDLVFEDNQESVDFFTLPDKGSFLYEEWLPGKTYTVTYMYEGVPFDVECEISECNVASIDYVQSDNTQPLVYGIDGSFELCGHEECAENENLYFNFDQTCVFPAEGDVITVTYTDNTTQVFTWEDGWLYDSLGEDTYEDVICLYDTQEENHWTTGDNTFTVRFFGCEDTVSVEVLDAVVESVSVSSEEIPEIYENTNGDWDFDENGNIVYVYDDLVYSPGVYVDITYTDDTVDRYHYCDEYGWFVNENGKLFPFDIYTSDDQCEGAWGQGLHTIEVEIDGFISYLEVSITENPVLGIDFHISETPTFRFENEEDGFFIDFGTEEDPYEVFIYYSDEIEAYAEGNSITVYYVDGSVVDYTYDSEAEDFTDEDGNVLSDRYCIELWDGQVEKEWVPGSTENYMVVEFLGSYDLINVVIDDGNKPLMAQIDSISNLENGVEITWECAADAAEYCIYRRLELPNGKPSSNQWVLVGTTNELEFIDTQELEAGAYYRYIVHGRNDNGRSVYVSAMAQLLRRVPFVENFTVTSTKSGVLFNWDRIEGYSIRLFRLEEGADEWVYLGDKPSDTAYLCNGNAESGKTYIYAAAYVSGDYTGDIAYSDYITYLSEPDLKTIKNAVTGIYFNWSEVEGAVGYRVYRRGEGERYYTYLGTTTNLWYCDSDVQFENGKYYKYTVRAIAEDGTMSSYENGLVLKRLIIPYIRSLTNDFNGITVKWSEIPGATAYRVYRRGAGQKTWTYITSVTGLSYTDTAVKSSAGSYYRYTVKAVVNGQFTGYNPDGPYTMRLTAPVLKNAVRDDDGINVTWRSVKGALGYNVYRKTADSTWVRIGAVKGTSFVDKTAEQDVTYTYTVRAYRGSYISSYYSTGVTA